MKNKKIVVVGGGPAGMMAAIRASALHQDVSLIEKNPILGKKLLLSGKGRCNLTNLCDLDSFLQRFSSSGQFLRGAFKKFFNLDLMNFFEKRGLRLKVERQQRVFPVSDKSDSVVEILKRELLKNKVKLIYKTQIKDIFTGEGKINGLLLGDGKLIPADRIILATGGVSYSFTGSNGKGIDLARKLGHRIIALRPGLVPLEIRQPYPNALEGLVLKNIRLKFSDGQRKIVSELGELLFTKSGISGPLILSLSGQIIDWINPVTNNVRESANKIVCNGVNKNRHVHVEIDFKPALSQEQLNARLFREFRLNPKKSIKNILKNLLPKRMADVFIDIAKISSHKKASQISQSERRGLVSLLKALRLDITKSKPIEEAMITRGGVSLKDIDPRTMESRIIKGLYFAGEMMDVDADTGGFNLQAAFSTGYLAGESAALS